MKEISKRIDEAITGKEVRRALVDGFLEADIAVKVILALQTIQGLAIIILGISAVTR